MNPLLSSSRREFCHTAIMAICGTTLLARPGCLAAEKPAGASLFSGMGLSGSIDKTAVYKSMGADFITESVGGFLMPDKDDAHFTKSLEKLKSSSLPILACNGFIRPAHLRCVGAEANHDEIMVWSEVAFRRLKQAGGKFIVFGSSGARAIRDGWSRAKADKQFVALLKKMGPAAAAHDVTVVVEQLQESECNYINHIAEGAALIRQAAHPNIRLLADLYHMAKMGDTPADLKAAMDVVVHIEIAEKENRTYPGVKGDDFRPYLRVLKDAGYKGAVSIEGRGTDDQLQPAFEEIRKQSQSL